MNGIPPDRPTKPALQHLDAMFAKMMERSDFPLSYLHKEYADAGRWRSKVLPTVFALLLHDPGPFVPKAKVVERVVLDKYIREKLYFYSSPEIQVPAYFLIPKNTVGPVPAVVALHDAGGLGIWGKEKLVRLPGENPVLQEHRRRFYGGESLAERLVARGYAVIVTDSFNFGERLAAPEGYTIETILAKRDTFSSEEVRRIQAKIYELRHALHRHLTLVGTTWPGIMAWDDIRTVDYLYTRPEVDPDRIGCLGLSVGGLRTNLLTALDSRVKAGITVGWTTTFRSLLGYSVPTTYYPLIPGLHPKMDLPDLMALAMPRALLTMMGWQDHLFQPSGIHEAIIKLRAAYEKGGYSDRFRAEVGDHPHLFDGQMQEKAFAWLDRWIGPVV